MVGMKPIHLTKEQVLHNAREAWNNGTLQAKECNHYPSAGCSYRNGEYRCVIGASLDTLAARAFDDLQGSKISSIFKAGYATADDPEYLTALQNLHDAVMATNAPLSKLEAVLFYGASPE